MTRTKELINPLAVIIGHQKVGQEDADKIALPVLCHLDAAKRGQGNGATADFLFQHLLTAQIMASKGGNKLIYNMSADAIAALIKAIARPSNLLNLTTGEYQAIRKCISAYLRILPTATVMAVGYAGQRALNVLQTAVKEAA